MAKWSGDDEKKQSGIYPLPVLCSQFTGYALLSREDRRVRVFLCSILFIYFFSRCVTWTCSPRCYCRWWRFTSSLTFAIFFRFCSYSEYFSTVLLFVAASLFLIESVNLWSFTYVCHLWRCHIDRNLWRRPPNNGHNWHRLGLRTIQIPGNSLQSISYWFLCEFIFVDALVMAMGSMIEITCELEFGTFFCLFY